MRRPLVIVILFLILFGVAAVSYFFFFSSSPGITVAPGGTATLPAAGPSAVGTVAASTTTVPVAPAAKVSARLVKISAGPVVSGEAVVDVPAKDASSTPDVAVHFIERQSGNVFAYSAGSGTLTRTSNRTIPGIEEAFWVPDGSLAFVRYLSGDGFATVNTYALPADGAGGFFLPQDLSGLAVSQTSVLALSSGVNGSTATLENTDGSHAASAFTTPLSALRIAFAGKSHYLAFTKPAAALPGAAFLVGRTGFSRIIGPLPGLSALPSPSGKSALISYSDASGMHLSLVDALSGAVTPLPVATIAEKCVWAADDSAVYCGIPVNPPAGTYPDDWYQGAAHFSDRVWKIDVAGRYAQLVLDFPQETKGELDMEAPATDASGTELVFVNKNDGSLWGYSL